MQNTLNFECKVENKSAIQRLLTITVTPESIQAYIEKQLVAVQKKAKIKGFRPGKVPLAIVKQQYMSDVKSDVFSKVIQDSYVKALTDNKINAIGNPKIEPKSGTTMEAGENLVYTAMVEVLPDFKLSDLSKIKVTKASSEIKSDEIKAAIENLRKSQADIGPNESYNGPAKDGDLAEITFSGTLEGKSPEHLNGKNRMLKLGAGNYMDDFEKNVLGMKKGETKNFDVGFPKDFQSKELAGKSVAFEVTLHEFKKEELPELDDEFAKRFKAENVADLKKRIEEDMRKTAERKSRNALKENLIDALISANSFEVPQHFLSMQLDYLIRENARTLLQQGYTEKMVKDYLEKNQEDLKSRSEKQVKATLILDKIAEQDKIMVEEADLEHEYSRIAADEKVDLEEVRKFFKDENSARELKFRLKEEKTIDDILSKVKVTNG